MPWKRLRRNTAPLACVRVEPFGTEGLVEVIQDRVIFRRPARLNVGRNAGLTLGNHEATKFAFDDLERDLLRRMPTGSPVSEELARLTAAQSRRAAARRTSLDRYTRRCRDMTLCICA